jgi:hypothetical protein
VAGGEFIRVERRFCGPPESGNGGYFAGLVAAHCPSVVTVRLTAPVPLDERLRLQRVDSELHVLHGTANVAVARAADPIPLPLPAPTYEQALEASRHFAGFRRHAFPTCFVCGPQRTRGDGLRVFAGPWRDDRVAAPWVPDASLAASDGKVAPEFMAAALDCPGYFAARVEVPMLLGEFTVHIDRRVHIDEPCVVIGWPIARSGRKHEVGTALYDEDGELCARARAVWIEARPVPAV